MLQIDEAQKVDIEIKTNHIFNYLNGKVNIVNRACILHIIWCNTGTLFGANFTPNQITILIGNIARMVAVNIDHLYVIITQTLIHELCHADQDIDDHLYTEDESYKNMIEASCEAMTSVLMPYYGIHILKDIGVNTSAYERPIYNLANRANSHFSLGDYKRITHTSQILNFLKFLLYSNPQNIYDYILYLISRRDSTIELVIRGQRVVLFHNDYVCDIVNFNSIILPLYTKAMASEMVQHYAYTIRFVTDYHIIIYCAINDISDLCHIVEKEDE